VLLGAAFGSPSARLVLSVMSVADLFAIIQPLHQSLDYHLERHNVLSSNVAHVDTPGYVPRDLARVDTTGFAGELRVAIEKTQPGHLTAYGPGASAGRVFEDPTAGAGADKNSVSLDREASKVAANHVRYDVVTTLVTAELAQLAFAASDGKG
jgi:flagellar basal-body rod protein FlgB